MADSIRYINTLPSHVDIIIIGAGIVGLFVAWELSKYDAKILVIDKEAEVGFGVSKGQTGILHVLQTPFKSLKSKFCIEGNKLYKDIIKELNVQVSWHKLYILALSITEIPILIFMYLYLKYKGYPVKLVRGKYVRSRDPIINRKVKLAIEVDSYGALNTFDMMYALAESASKNGVYFLMDTNVISIDIKDGNVRGVYTDKGYIKCKIVINAAGLHADELANVSLGQNKYTYVLAKGVNIIFDDPYHQKEFYVEIPKHKDPRTKGGGALLTWDGKIIWGPDFTAIHDKSDLSVTFDNYYDLTTKFSKLFERPPMEPISIYAGIRPINHDKDDFKIVEDARGMISLIGIDSPGFTAAPILAKRVLEFVDKHNFKLKMKRRLAREMPKAMINMDLDELDKLIKSDPDWGIIIGVDPPVSLGEIKEALKRGAKTLDGLRFRTGLWMGREQDMPYLPDLILFVSHILGIEVCEFTKKGGESRLVYGVYYGKENKK